MTSFIHSSFISLHYLMTGCGKPSRERELRPAQPASAPRRPRLCRGSIERDSRHMRREHGFCEIIIWLIDLKLKLPFVYCWLLGWEDPQDVYHPLWPTNVLCEGGGQWHSPSPAAGTGSISTLLESEIYTSVQSDIGDTITAIIPNVWSTIVRWML